MAKNSPANAGATRNMDSIPGLERSTGEVNGNPLQYSSLENPVHKGTWRAAVTKNWIKLSDGTCT